MSTSAPAPSPAPAPGPRGLEGISAGQTAVAAVQQDKLIYRGYEIHDLAENATFEEVAFLLLEGHKPSGDELARFSQEVVAERAIPAQVRDFLKACAGPLKEGTAVPMDVLRSAVSMLAHVDRDSQDNSAEANLRKAKRLLAKIPTVIGHMQSVIDGREMVDPDTGGDPKLSHAANLLYLMSGKKPAEDFARVMDVSLILYAEHDFNASTFTGRVIAATLSDMHGGVTGAIAALKGPLHGGANEAAMDMLREIMSELGDNEGGPSLDAVQGWMHAAFAQKRKLMGFGHRVYKHGDHRAGILKALGRGIAEQQGPQSVKWFDLGDKVEQIMRDEKNIFPNVDFPCGMTYYVMGIPVPQYTPIFVASRLTGWAAHIMEQHADNRLIRPVADYVGEPMRRWNG